jgi:hypothetical protein
MIRLTFLPILAALTAAPLHAEFQAGAAVIDITPLKLPVLANGGMLSRYVDKIKTPIHARAMVLSDAKTQVAIVVAEGEEMPTWQGDGAPALRVSAGAEVYVQGLRIAQGTDVGVEVEAEVGVKV